MTFPSLWVDPVVLVMVSLFIFGVLCIAAGVTMWAVRSSKVGPDGAHLGPVPVLRPIAPMRKLMATPESSEAVAAGIAASRWRGQLANNTGWNEVTSDQAAIPDEPSLPGRDLPNPEVDTRAIKRAAETNRPLLVGPAEEEKKVQTEIRDRLDRLHALFPSQT